MAIIKRAVGHITLSRIVDVVSTTYFYLLMPSAAARPSKPTVSPPPVYETEGYSGWSETEPGYTSGDTRSLYITIRTIYGDGSFEYTTPSLSSSYEAAKIAYNRAQSAMSLAGDINQYFWNLTSAYSTNVPAGTYITEVAQSLFKPNPSGGNVVIQSTGITIRNGITQLSSLTGQGLNFYDPNASQGNNNLILSINNGGILQSGNYSRGSDAKFSTNGTKIDLTNGDIITKYFRLSQGLENLNAGAYIHGTIEALDGIIGAGSDNYWDIGQYTDYNLNTNATIIGHGGSFIQLGDSSTWRLATNRIHTGWYTNDSTVLHYPKDTNNKYWDFGIHVPYSDSPSGRGNDKFVYIRTQKAANNSLENLLYDLDDNYNTQQWEYKFYVDSSGNITTTGSIDAHNISIDGQSIAGGSLIAGSLASYGGSATQPVYFPSSGDNQGKPVAIDYTIGQSVPSDSIWIKNIITNGSGNAVTAVSFDSTTGQITATKGATYLTSYTETDPTVPAWAKASTKPSYSYNEITGTVPQSALPSYVDDVLEYNGQSSFPTTGETGKIYVDTSTNKTYRWGGTSYVEISSSLALGETSSTAYRGDRGKTAYDHASAKGSAFTSGLYKITTNNEGHVTAATAASKSDIGLGNVDNKSSATIRSEITSTNVTDALGFTPYDNSNPAGYITSADVSDTKVNVSTRGSTKAYLLSTTSSPTSTKTAREAVAETGVYLDTNDSNTRLIAPTFVGNLTGTASGNLTSNSSLAWSKVTGANDLKAIENLSDTSGLLRKTAANTWELDTTNYLSSFTESDPVFSASAASGITSSDITNWNNKTSNAGTVTSVRVQATSPVKSSTSSAQNVSLNTTISLQDAYGDLKNPYSSKTARYVLAAPADVDGAPSFRALTNADVGLNNVINTKQITNITNEFQDGVNTGRLVIWKGENDSQVLEVQITAREATTATNATNDSDGDPINTTYGTSLGWTSGTRVLALKNKSGTNLSTVTIPDADTTYTFADGTNGFTVTPKGGTAKTVNVTPSIANNVTGSGTSGKLVKWNGTNTITDGPTFTSGGTGYLKEDGTWGTPGGTYSLPTAKYDTLGGLKPWYSTTGASTLASGSAGTNTSTPSINARSSTAGKYYAVEIDKNGRLYVNVPWTNTNGSYLTSAVTTLTTQAGAHTVVSSASGDVTIKIPTATSHLTNDSGYITGYVDEKVKLTSKSDNVAYKVTLGPSSITSGSAYEGYYSTNLTYNPSGKELSNGTAKLKTASSTTANTAAYDTLTLGNNVAVSSTTAHSQGRLVLYGSTTYAHTIQGAPTAARTITLPDQTGTVALTSDLSDFITDPGVTKITTTAGAHTAITNATGAVSFNVPTTAAHVGIKFGYTTSGNNRAVQQDSSGNLYVTQKDDNTNTFKSFYGTCSTVAATAAKTVTLSVTTGWQLVAGTVVGVKFTETNTAQNPTLNVNGSGAKSIYVNTAVLTTSNLWYAGEANRVHYYMYDGTNWIFMGHSFDWNTDTKVTQSATTTANWRKLLLHYKDDTTSTTAVTSSTNQVYAAVGISAQPSTGIIRTSGYNISDKATMKYDSTLDAVVFTFI